MADTSGSGKQPTNNTRSARNNRSSRSQRQRYKGQFDAKFIDLSFDAHSLKPAQYQLFKSDVLGFVMTECTNGLHLYTDLNNEKDTWSSKAMPAMDEKDDMNFTDRKNFKKNKEQYLNDTLKIATMILAQCNDEVREKFRKKADYDTMHVLAVWVIKTLYKLCSGVKDEDHPLV
mmetsp:Transcript_27296/g.40314  ORF Transcript_27296/g.40314 Transcript_27296/m.40314 type:complete len:174 (-) Transcript_27296:1056-1577(-)